MPLFFWLRAAIFHLYPQVFLSYGLYGLFLALLAIVPIRLTGSAWCFYHCLMTLGFFAYLHPEQALSWPLRLAKMRDYTCVLSVYATFLAMAIFIWLPLETLLWMLLLLSQTSWQEACLWGVLYFCLAASLRSLCLWARWSLADLPVVLRSLVMMAWCVPVFFLLAPLVDALFCQMDAWPLLWPTVLWSLLTVLLFPLLASWLCSCLCD